MPRVLPPRSSHYQFVLPDDLRAELQALYPQRGALNTVINALLRKHVAEVKAKAARENPISLPPISDIMNEVYGEKP